MVYKVTGACLKCGLCISRCPEKAIIPERKIKVDGLVLQPVHIDSQKCNDCGTCVSMEYWCPALAIVKA
jgi:NAD-dependent dihydropyrimidine dehydrogenase PreA subunit